MKRMHVNLAVTDLDASIAFYNSLFDSEPDVIKSDYAKWMLEDPRINFAISTRAGKTGVDHLGLQVEEESELQAIRESLSKADIHTFDDGEAVCCYARSEKSWVRDPAGVAWETYQTMEDVQLFKEGDVGSSCCVAETKSSCC